MQVNECLNSRYSIGPGTSLIIAYMHKQIKLVGSTLPISGLDYPNFMIMDMTRLKPTILLFSICSLNALVLCPSFPNFSSPGRCLWLHCVSSTDYVDPYLKILVVIQYTFLSFFAF